MALGGLAMADQDLREIAADEPTPETSGGGAAPSDTGNGSPGGAKDEGDRAFGDEDMPEVEAPGEGLPPTDEAPPGPEDMSTGPGGGGGGGGGLFDQIGDAYDDVEDAAHDAYDDAEEGANNVGDGAESLVDDVKEEAAEEWHDATRWDMGEHAGGWLGDPVGTVTAPAGWAEQAADGLKGGLADGYEDSGLRDKVEGAFEAPILQETEKEVTEELEDAGTWEYDEHEGGVLNPNDAVDAVGLGPVRDGAVDTISDGYDSSGLRDPAEDAAKWTGERFVGESWEDRDDDGDGLSNQEEWELGTDWHDSDSDGDGTSDSEELEYGSDPTDHDSAPPEPTTGGGLESGDSPDLGFGTGAEQLAVIEEDDGRGSGTGDSESGGELDFGRGLASEPSYAGLDPTSPEDLEPPEPVDAPLPGPEFNTGEPAAVDDTLEGLAP